MQAAATTPTTSPVEAEVLRIRGLLERNQFGAALSAGEALAVKVPENRDVLYMMAVSQRYLQQVPEALATLERLERHHPGFSRLYQERGHCFVTLRVAQRDKAMPALLVQTAEPGMMPLEPLQGGKRLGNLLQITLTDGHHVEDVAVLRNLDGQGLACAQSGAELIALEESSNAQDFRFDGRCGRCCRGCLHCFQKKRRAQARL